MNKDFNCWTYGEMLESTQYGKLYLITKVLPNNKARIARIHRRKGKLMPERETTSMDFKMPIYAGQIIFLDREGIMTLFDDTFMKEKKI